LFGARSVTPPVRAAADCPELDGMLRRSFSAGLVLSPDDHLEASS
jgi:hypothetical protein